MNGQVCTNSSVESASGVGGEDRDEPGPSRLGYDAADQDNPPEPTGSQPDAARPVQMRAHGVRVSDADLAWLERRLGEVAEHLATPIRRAEIAIVDDAAMTALHARHLGIDATTDVLTFALNAPDEPIDADIAVCADEAARQASARGHDLRRELLLYMLHGLLHCCGHDDQVEEAWAAMHAEEDRILHAIGVGRVFAARSGDHPSAPGHDGARRMNPRDKGTGT